MPSVPSRWPATYLSEEELPTTDADWARLEQRAEKRVLGQTWRQDGLEAEFQTGWAQVFWNPKHLLFNVALEARSPRNRACGLNRETWKLGDVCEIFLRAENDDRYIELHVTPENERLQLVWTTKGFAAFRRDQSTLPHYTVGLKNWVQTTSQITVREWFVRALIAFTCLGSKAKPFSANTVLQSAVCRYDTTAKADLILSSTARLRKPSFHRRSEWSPLVLLPRPTQPGRSRGRHAKLGQPSSGR
jgi:hypothetical protein